MILKNRVIIVDSAIPYIKGIFDDYCNVIYCDATQFYQEINWTTKHFPSAKIALIIRTRTKCNELLLRNSNVDFISSATIGTDHIDLNYCANNNIIVCSAPGCNSGGVAQYVFTALYYLSGVSDNPIIKSLPHTLDTSSSVNKKITLGVVGMGNVGSKVVKFANQLGFNVLINDPPQERLSNKKIYSSIEKLLSDSDIVTLHIPLDDTTRGLANRDFFSKMKSGAIFINTSRGEVVIDSDLIEAKHIKEYILDVWNGEPNINTFLLNNASVATPHIAGYSNQGKENGSSMVISQLAKYLSIKELENYCVRSENQVYHLDKKADLREQLLNIFPIYQLDKKLRNSPDLFEELRSGYSLRNEFFI